MLGGKVISTRITAPMGPGMALCLALAACASAAPAAHTIRQAPPVSVSGPALSVRIDVRSLTPHSVDLVVYLVARESLPAVRVRAYSTDRRLSVTRGCAFHPLQPPHPEVLNAGKRGGARESGTESPTDAGRARRAPLPLPLVPLCSLVLDAAQPGHYPLDVLIVDDADHELVSPIRTVVDIGRTP